MNNHEAAIVALEELIAEWAPGGIFGDRAGTPPSVALAEAVVSAYYQELQDDPDRDRDLMAELK